MSETNTTTYIGLTIGPIYKTLRAARKTVELWAASYLFSHLMKKIVAAVLNLSEHNSNYKATILNPLANANRGEGSAGLYPDHLILESHGEQDFDMTLGLVKEEVEALGRRISRCFPRENESDVVASIAHYLQTYLVELPTKADIDKSHNTVKEHLNTAELQTCYKANDYDAKDFLSQFLRELKSNRRWLEDVFELERRPEVRSLATIALASLKAKDARRWSSIRANEDEDDWMSTAKEVFGDTMKKRHSYVAIVHADGDNVGNTIGQLGSREAYQDFCNRLMNFGEASIREIKRFGGLPIYAGGDDLLFFAPIEGIAEGNAGDHIFNLLERLDHNFSHELEPLVREVNNRLFKDGKDPVKLPTLSFGLSISYYKFPLYEALDYSRGLLFDTAKNNPGKHSIGLQIRLHSDNTLNMAFSLAKTDEGHYKDASYRHLHQLVGESLLTENLRLNSVTHALDKNKAALSTIGNDPLRMEVFFENSFDEDVHKQVHLKGFWQTVRSLVTDSYDLPKLGEMKQAANHLEAGRAKDKAMSAINEAALDNAESVLRILHFLNQANDEQ